MAGVPDDDEFITQLGSLQRRASGALPFRNRPRRGETGLSAIRGIVSVFRAVALVRPSGPSARQHDAVRCARVGELTVLGFAVILDPVPLNPDHVLVKADADWDEARSAAFDSAFGEDLQWIEEIREGYSA